MKQLVTSVITEAKNAEWEKESQERLHGRTTIRCLEGRHLSLDIPLDPFWDLKSSIPLGWGVLA